jgi:hypothetical protein
MQKVSLTHAITAGGAKVQEITVRRPKVRDLRQIEALRSGSSEIDQGVSMVAVLSGLSPDEIDEMDAGDFARVSEIVAGFFQPPASPDGGQ